MKFKAKSRQGTIVTRLNLIMLVPFVCFLIVIVLFLGVYYRKQAVKEIIEQSGHEDEMLRSSLETRIRNAESSANTIIITMNEMLSAEDLNGTKGPAITPLARKKIYNCMLNTFTIFGNAEKVLVVWNNGVTWYENWVENYSMQDDGADTIIALQQEKVNRNGKWMRELDVSSRISGEGPFYAKKYLNIATGETLGYVILKPIDLLEDLRSDNERRWYYLISPDGELFYGTDDGGYQKTGHMKNPENSESLGSPECLERLDESRFHVARYKVHNTWEMVSVTDMRAETRELDRTILTIMATIFLIMILIYLYMRRFSDELLSPLVNLSNHMIKSPDELPTPVQEPSPDNEIGVLIKHFNIMTQRNSQLVNMLIEEKKQQEQLKFQLLQEQIKPHFLYNTLDTIYCLAIMGQNKDAADMTKLLSDYYRHVLSNGMDWVLLSEEIEQTRDYLKIQSIRYADLLNFQIDMERNVDNIRIPKLTIQPLVENAIYHGIKPLRRRGNLSVKVDQEDMNIFIRVIDDGIGMTREQFDQEISGEETKKDGFGIRNVAERLKFYYGERCKFYLGDRSAGTEIVLKIAVIPGEI